MFSEISSICKMYEASSSFCDECIELVTHLLQRKKSTKKLLEALSSHPMDRRRIITAIKDYTEERVNIDLDSVLGSVSCADAAQEIKNKLQNNSVTYVDGLILKDKNFKKYVCEYPASRFPSKHHITRIIFDRMNAEIKDRIIEGMYDEDTYLSRDFVYKYFALMSADERKYLRFLGRFGYTNKCLIISQLISRNYEPQAVHTSKQWDSLGFRVIRAQNAIGYISRYTSSAHSSNVGEIVFKWNDSLFCREQVAPVIYEYYEEEGKELIFKEEYETAKKSVKDDFLALQIACSMEGVDIPEKEL